MKTFTATTKNENWQARAACRGQDPEMFFAYSGAKTHRALEVCAGCPVRMDCLEWAVETGQDHGVWGGTTEEARREMRAGEQPGMSRAEQLAAAPDRMLELITAGYSPFSVATLLATNVATINRAKELLGEHTVAMAEASGGAR